MKIISFAWTTDALLQGRKTVTRRNWKKQMVFKNETVQAYNRQPRFGGKPVALIRIIDIRQEPLFYITDEDEIKEGHLWGNAENYIKSYLDAYPGMKGYDMVWRIEFEVTKIL